MDKGEFFNTIVSIYFPGLYQEEKLLGIGLVTIYFYGW
ncbi:hypothetical protein RINTHH_17150 [Richelia intracellularis HH01]|uniref:Uncharacterized protein n=1 Tax=Richelia intracellularis HH01 TaxID=1165094 RepID=M1X332_9NOST|nr:hypothetical protein RINTHH_17150 [Richelia intracellularis HH01]